MHRRVGKIYRAVAHTIRGAAHENKILFVGNRTVQDLPAVFQSLTKKSLLIIARRRNTDQQFICIGFHGILEQVVLLGLLKCVDFQICYRGGFLSPASSNFLEVRRTSSPPHPVGGRSLLEGLYSAKAGSPSTLYGAARPLLLAVTTVFA